MVDSDRSRLCEWLRSERDERVSHGLYYNTQLVFAYNSNHMEGSTLTPEQTAQLFDTGALLPDSSGDQIRLDDVMETSNHFRAFNWILDHVDEPVDKRMVCELHAILKHGTLQERNPDRNVGGWKILPNVIGQLEGTRTVLPKDVPAAMDEVFRLLRDLRDDPYEIAKAHWMFETTHPFSDGNGRIGRLILFKELLRLDAIPPLIRDENRNYYTRGLKLFGGEPSWLVDTLLNERDFYKKMVDTYAPGCTSYTYVDEWRDRSRIESEHAARPLRNPFIKDVWTEDDIHARTRSEHFVLGFGFVPFVQTVSPSRGSDTNDADAGKRASDMTRTGSSAKGFPESASLQPPDPAIPALPEPGTGRFGPSPDR